MYFGEILIVHFSPVNPMSKTFLGRQCRFSQHLGVGKLKDTAENIFTSAWFQYRN